MYLNQEVLRKAVSNNLLIWWNSNKRVFPWRLESSPYKILIAEIMLHRTKAEQVEGTFMKFVSKFPDLASFLESNKKEIKEIMTPLGLNWRTEYLVKLAGAIKRDSHGIIPADKKELITLPGIGDYIASAIRCFGFGYSEILVDTNTSRIISRFFGLSSKGERRRNPEVREKYLSIMNHKKPQYFNYALIDLGAKVCKSKIPNCINCTLNKLCKMGRIIIKADETADF